MTTRKAPKKPAKEAQKATNQRASTKPDARGQKPPSPPPPKQSKQAQLIVLLQQATGTTIAEAASALGWQPHSIRGVLSGVIKKKLKLAVEKFDDEGVTRYRVAG